MAVDSPSVSLGDEGPSSTTFPVASSQHQLTQYIWIAESAVDFSGAGDKEEALSAGSLVWVVSAVDTACSFQQGVTTQSLIVD